MDTGKRLARLEEQLYFQEHAIQELNDALLAQQRQMDAMEHALKIMAEREQNFWTCWRTGRKMPCLHTTCRNDTEQAILSRAYPVRFFPPLFAGC